MLGLTAICDRIILDAKRAAEEKLLAANKEASRIKCENRAALASCDIQADKMLSELKASEQSKLSSMLAAKERDALLKTEYDTISEIILAAKSRLSELPKAEYFDLLAKLFKKYCTLKDGELLITEADKKRMDKFFLSNLGNITLAKENAPSSGFILRRGDIEENCTFDAIFKAEENRLFDIVSACIKR